MSVSSSESSPSSSIGSSSYSELSGSGVGGSSDSGASSSNYQSSSSSASSTLLSTDESMSTPTPVPAQWVPDVTPASKRELRGWYCYDWANSVYSSVALVFIPVVILEMASNASGVPDDDTCVPGEGSKYTIVDANNQTMVVDDNYFKVKFGATNVAPSALALYLVSISVVIQVFFFISHGALADFGHWRKKFLGFYAFLGSLVTMAFILFVDEDMWELPGAFLVISNVFFGTSIVFYNAYLPVLVDAHPTVVEYEAAQIESSSLSVDPAELEELKEKVSNIVSTHGFAAGYGSGTLVLIVSVGILLALGTDTTFALRLCIFLSGLWWAIFTVPTLLTLRARPGPPIPEGESNYLFFSWKTLFGTLSHLRRYPHTFAFLGAFFIFSDGYSTISTAGVLFAAEELCMSSAKLGIIALIPPFAALLGNYLFLWIQNKGHFQTKTMLITNLILLAVLPLWGMLGFASDTIGLRNEWEMYLFATWYGLNLGAIQSFARVIYAALIPAGKESEYFSLFEITDKGSSWIGPLVVAGVRDATGSLRWGLFYLVFLLLLPLVVLYFVDVKQGSIEARQKPLMETLKLTVLEHKVYKDGEVASETSTGVVAQKQVEEGSSTIPSLSSSS